MDEDTCFRCERKNSEVKLLDAVYQNEIVKICEECSLLENIPIIRKPTSQQLKEENKPYNVRQRLSRMAGLNESKARKEEVLPVLTLDRLRKPKDYKSILDSKFQQAKKRNQPLNLIDNFNWHIQMARKRSKISRKQLADTIGEAENTIKLLEENFLPDDALRVIAKIEQYFGIKLRTGNEPVSESLSVIEPSQHVVTPKPAVVLKFDKETSNSITIDDLRRLKKEKDRIEKEGELEEKPLEKEEPKANQSFISRLIWGRKDKKEEPLEGSQLEGKSSVSAEAADD